MKLNVKVFFWTSDFDAIRVGVDLVGFDLLLHGVLGMMRAVVVELREDKIVGVGFGLKVFSFGIMAIVSEDVILDVSFSFVFIVDFPSDDTISNEVSSAQASPGNVVSSDIISADIVSSEMGPVSIMSSDAVLVDMISVGIIPGGVVSENILSDHVSKDVASHCVDLSRNSGSGLRAIECGVIDIRAIE